VSGTPPPHEHKPAPTSSLASGHRRTGDADRRSSRAGRLSLARPAGLVLGVEVGTFAEPDPEPSGAYSSTLTITVDGEPVDPEPLLGRDHRRAAEQRLAIRNAMSSAVDRGAEVLAATSDAEHADAARDRIAELLGVVEVCATAVLHLQVRRFSKLGTPGCGKSATKHSPQSSG
jgi:hypothetical protein